MEVKQTIQQLLAEYSEQVPPDYATFYIKIQELVTSGVSPGTFCDSMVELFKEQQDELEAIFESNPSPQNLSSEERLNAIFVHNRWKMLYGCTTRLPGAMANRIFSGAGIGE